MAGAEAQSSPQAGASAAEPESVQDPAQQSVRAEAANQLLANLPPPAASHYALLRLTPQATAAELRQAFRTLSKCYHPDTTSLPAPLAEEQFRRLQLAYTTLSDPERRRRYDVELQRAKELAAVPLPRPVLTVPAPPAVRRALSGGEWFALLLLALALLFSLVLGLGLAWARGTALVRLPSWWPVEPAGQTALASAPATADGHPASTPDSALQPSTALPGGLAAGSGRPPAGGQPLPLGSAPAPLERPH